MFMVHVKMILGVAKEIETFGLVEADNKQNEKYIRGIVQILRILYKCIYYLKAQDMAGGH